MNKNELIVVSGTTVRIMCEFYNFSDKLSDPTVVKFLVYDEKYRLLETITLTDANKLEVGKYFYDYKTPKESGKRVYYEFYGEIAGNPTVDRGAIRTAFII